MSVLTGVLIPSAVMKSSPQEFVDINYFYNPIWFIVSSFCLAFGIFVIWMGVFYWLAKPSVKPVFDRAVWIFSGAALINYMFFGRNLGLLNASLKYENGLNFSLKQQLINAAVILASAVVLYFISKLGRKRIFDILVIFTVAVSGMSAFNIASINSSVSGIKALTDDNKSENPGFTLSRNGKNVIVLMLDRAMGQYVPYIFNEKPELKEQFSGFTYYSNVISFGGQTNFGAPALFGGYEYTPYEMNKRSSESLMSKHNEALKVMPVLFDQNDFNVTVCDPPYANYQWIPDLSIYHEYPQINKYITKGKFSDASSKERFVQNNTRNFFCYGILKAAPLCFQEVLYDRGVYNQSDSVQDEVYSGQTADSTLTSAGINPAFMECYNVLTNLPLITDVSDGADNTFLMMTNDITHEPMMLQEPEYTPSNSVDNTEYEENNKDRFTLNGKTLKMETEQQVIHYQTNMATMIQLGKWFDYMRENGVYDNTRIILVSDHGRLLEHSDELMLEDGMDLAYYYPLLMVKDFNSSGFVTSDEFMTNGDVPTLATGGIIDNPVNPFTGKLINADEKTAHDQYIIASFAWDVNTNNGNKFLPSKWYAVHDSLWNKENWKVVQESDILPEE